MSLDTRRAVVAEPGMDQPAVTSIEISLQAKLVRELLWKHPLPWRIEEDWTLEVTDVNHHVVLKCMTVEEANELIGFAKHVAAESAKNKADVEQILAEHGAGTHGP
jgi:hypothetical protein